MTPKVLVVCLGNICRSPLGEGILRHKLIAKGYTDFIVDSAGTSGHHEGQQPDTRSIAVAHKNGIDISMQRARKFKIQDFEIFDHILVMDTSNYNDLIALSSNKTHHNKINLVLNYQYPNSNKVVPDPYYGGKQEFQQVFELLDQAINHFIDKAFHGSR